MEQSATTDHIQRIAGQQEQFKERIGSHKKILSVRQLGTILAIEIKTPEETGYMNSLADKISSWFIKKGILLRPLGNVLYILPPYSISTEDLSFIYNSIEEFLNTEI